MGVRAYVSVYAWVCVRVYVHDVATHVRGTSDMWKLQSGRAMLRVRVCALSVAWNRWCLNGLVFGS